MPARGRRENTSAVSVLAREAPYGKKLFCRRETKIRTDGPEMKP
jgi:hypothetical protein